MTDEIIVYNNKQTITDKMICDMLANIITQELVGAENKIWHGHPVWFLNANPIVGYSKQKSGLRLMFWSGADFDEEDSFINGKKFKDASVFYNSVAQIVESDLIRWLYKSKFIQWDYKNIVKRKGKLERLPLNK